MFESSGDKPSLPMKGTFEGYISCLSKGLYMKTLIILNLSVLFVIHLY